MAPPWSAVTSEGSGAALESPFAEAQPQSYDAEEWRSQEGPSGWTSGETGPPGARPDEAEQWPATVESPFAAEPHTEAEQSWATHEELAWIDHKQRFTAAGIRAVDSHPLLASHRGQNKPDLILKWNAMTSPTRIDVVVHLHGFSSCPPKRRPQQLGLATNVLKISGLDFADPDNPNVPGRAEPTLAILPRGSYAGDLPGRNKRAYQFPALVRPGALNALVDDALGRFRAMTGIDAPLGRLIVSAHSGGGATLMSILRHSDPDEIYVFDALYGNPNNLIRWARRHIRRDIAGGPGSAGAMRVLYEDTRRGSKKVWDAVCNSLRGADPAIRRRYRVEAASGHCVIPRRYGWLLLRDAGANLPRTKALACRGNRAGPASRKETRSPSPNKETEGQRPSDCAGCRGASALDLFEDHKTEESFDEAELAPAEGHERYQDEASQAAEWHENASLEEREDLYHFDQAEGVDALAEYEDLEDYGEAQQDEELEEDDEAHHYGEAQQDEELEEDDEAHHYGEAQQDEELEEEDEAHHYEEARQDEELEEDDEAHHYEEARQELEEDDEAHHYEEAQQDEELEEEDEAHHYEEARQELEEDDEAHHYEEAQRRDQADRGARSRPRILGSQALRNAWRQYQCAESRMVRLRLFGWNTPVNPETLGAWRALEQAMTASGYQPHRVWVFVCRDIANSKARSLHAYGLAIDIDHRQPVCNVNRRTRREVRFSQGATKAERCADVRRNVADTSFTPAQVAAVLAIRTNSGHQVFAWGGHWKSTKDTMHFQINVTPQQLATGIRSDSVMRGQGFAADDEGFPQQHAFEDEFEDELAYASPEALNDSYDREENFGDLDEEEWEEERDEPVGWLGEARSGLCSGDPAEVPPGNPIPFAPPPGPGSYWPIVTSSKAGRTVTYLAADGSSCAYGHYHGRRFLARRGDRLHLGVDLWARAGDPVVACEDGKIIAFYAFCCGKNLTSWALLVAHANMVINYGEVAPELPSGLAKGSLVRAGQVIARIGRNPSGSSMLHFETYRLGTKTNQRWVKGKPRPTGVLNPTRYLLSLRDHGLTGSVGSIVSATAPAAKPSVPRGPASTAGGISPGIIARIDRWDDLINEVATARGLNPSIVKGIIAAESGGNPDTGGQNLRGYKGLMQATKDRNQLIPEVSIRTGIDHFLKKRAAVSRILRSVGVDLGALDEDTQLGYLMTAYNAGEGTLKAALGYAKAANALGAWERPEFFQRALFFTGAYNPRAALAWCLKRMPAEAGASALGTVTGVAPDRLLQEYHGKRGWDVRKLRRDLGRTINDRLNGERLALRFNRSLTLERAVAQASPLLACAAQFKHVHRPVYIKRVLTYKRYYDARRRSP